MYAVLVFVPVTLAAIAPTHLFLSRVGPCAGAGALSMAVNISKLSITRRVYDFMLTGQLNVSGEISDGWDIKQNFQDNRRIAKAILEALQDTNFDNELTFDLKKENQVHLNRTMSLLIKYIVKREVDNYRTRRADAISRKVYSSLIMKLIDIAKDIPRNASTAQRIDTAHRYYMSVESRDLHDEIADRQVFHACARLYDILLTAPRILTALGKLDDLTPRVLVRKLKSIEVKPVHLAVLLLVQYHLRQTINYAIRTKVVKILSAKPQMVGLQVINTLKELATHLLPVAELLDIHLAHSSPLFKNSCPATWLGIVNNK